MSYTYPSSFVDTSPNGFNPLSLTNQFYSEADAGSELGGSYYTPPIGGEMSHAYPTYNGPSLSQTTPSLPSTSSVESPASWESSSSQTSGFPSDDLSQLFSEPNTTNANPQPVVRQPGTRRRGGSSLRSRRTIGQKIKKPAGMRYAAKLRGCPEEFQQAIMGFYDCCAKVNMDDESTRKKHRGTNEHFKNVPKQFHHLQTTYVCPAFLSMHFSCRNAKPGRYDAAGRHCLKCPGFWEMVKLYCEPKVEILIPVEVTRGEFEAVLEFRRNAQPGEESNSPRVTNASLKVGAMIDTQTRGGSTQTLGV